MWAAGVPVRGQSHIPSTPQPGEANCAEFINCDIYRNGHKYGSAALESAKNSLRTKAENQECLLYLLETNEWYQVKNICLCLFRFKASKFAPYFNFLRAPEEAPTAHSEAD